MNQQMSPLMGRFIMVVLGALFIAGTLALTLPSVKRGYFLGKHGQVFRRGETSYSVHCGLMLLCLGVGAGFVAAGVVLSDEQLMRRSR